MKIEHIAMRLEAAAAYHTPGRPTPDFPMPVNENILYREAAQWLRILKADLDGETNSHSREHSSHHRRWAFVDEETDSMIGFCNGTKPQALRALRFMLEKKRHPARSVLLRAIYLGED